VRAMLKLFLSDSPLNLTESQKRQGMLTFSVLPVTSVGSVTEWHLLVGLSPHALSSGSSGRQDKITNQRNGLVLHMSLSYMLESQTLVLCCKDDRTGFSVIQYFPLNELTRLRSQSSCVKNLYPEHACQGST
jgi:hypothetical protein